MTTRAGDIPCWESIGSAGDGSCARLAGALHCRHCPVYSAAGRSLLDRPPADDYLDEQTLLLAREEQPAPRGAFAAAIFRVGGQRCALRAACVQKVAQGRPVHRLPYRTDRVLLGVANVEGEILLCASIPGLADWPDGPGPARFVLVAGRSAPERWAFPVDAVEGLLSIAPADMAPEPGLRLAAGRFDTAAGPTLLLDDEALFAALERHLSP